MAERGMDIETGQWNRRYLDIHISIGRCMA